MDQYSDQFQPAIAYLVTLFTQYGLRVLAAFIILILGLWIAGRAAALVRRVLSRSRYIDATLLNFFASAIKYLIIALTVIAVLDKFGVETTSLLAVLGAAGLAIGLALQGTLSHIAAGIMLLIFRPFRVGDHIELEKIEGSVDEVTLFFTVMTTKDGIHMIVPNGLIWGQWIRNHSVKKPANPGV
jgi:small conductance mechanosensitive channel